MTVIKKQVMIITFLAETEKDPKLLLILSSVYDTCREHESLKISTIKCSY